MRFCASVALLVATCIGVACAANIEWQHHFNFPISDPDFFTTLPVVGHDTKRFFVTVGTSLRALSRDSGEELWSVSAGFHYNHLSTFAFENDYVIVLDTHNGTLCGIHSTNGSVAFSIKPFKSFQYPRPVMLSDRIFAINTNNGIKAYEFHNGAEAWQYTGDDFNTFYGGFVADPKTETVAVFASYHSGGSATMIVFSANGRILLQLKRVMPSAYNFNSRGIFCVFNVHNVTCLQATKPRYGDAVVTVLSSVGGLERLQNPQHLYTLENGRSTDVLALADTAGPGFEFKLRVVVFNMSGTAPQGIIATKDFYKVGNYSFVQGVLPVAPAGCTLLGLAFSSGHTSSMSYPCITIDAAVRTVFQKTLPSSGRANFPVTGNAYGWVVVQGSNMYTTLDFVSYPTVRVRQVQQPRLISILSRDTGDLVVAAGENVTKLRFGQ